jgi:GxxExxY protein
VTIDELSFQIIGAAMVVHTDLGPGLSEKPYDTCFGDQLSKLGLQSEHQVRFPVRRDGRLLQATFRVDYVVREAIIVEIKAVHFGLIVNFSVAHLRDGIARR